MKKLKMKRVNNPRRNLIEFGYMKTVTDSQGFQTKEWRTTKKTYASIRGLRGNEVERANSIKAIDKKVFNCNYFEGLETDTFIKYKGDLYNIYSLENTYEENHTYIIYAARADSSE